MNCHYDGCPNNAAYNNIPISNKGRIEYVGICFRHMHERATSTSISEDITNQQFTLENAIEISARLGTDTETAENDEHNRNQ